MCVWVGACVDVHFYIHENDLRFLNGKLMESGTYHQDPFSHLRGMQYLVKLGVSLCMSVVMQAKDPVVFWPP